MNNDSIISIDGAQGEGGGQVLRTALSLSMITGQAFEIHNIRANRARTGLLRQHLTAVKAASEICSAQVQGLKMGSSALHFLPGKIRGGNYEYAIGSAGSTTLVLQTILPALWFADEPSQVTITGGTHNHAAPPADFLIHTWCPILWQMGVQQTIKLKAYGFYPAGGGKIVAQVIPVDALEPYHVCQRGSYHSTQAHACVSGLASDTLSRQLEYIKKHLPQASINMQESASMQGVGNVVMITVHHENISLVFCGFGQSALEPEEVAYEAIKHAQNYMQTQSVADEYLADQLLLPMALAGQGSFTTDCISSHFKTNCEIIQKFLPVQINTHQQENGWLIKISS